MTLRDTSSRPSVSSLVCVRLREWAHTPLPSGGDGGHGFLACACGSDLGRMSTTPFQSSSRLPHYLASLVASFRSRMGLLLGHGRVGVQEQG